MEDARQRDVRGDADISSVAALLAEPSRAAMLTALLDGRALAAGELAKVGGVGAATASAHLARLLDGGLVVVVRQGRHRYYRLAGAEVAEVMEVLARVSPRPAVRSLRQSRQAWLLGEARTCYDHLAGRAGVELLGALVEGGHLEAVDDGYPGGIMPDAFVVSARGEVRLKELGVDLDAARRGRRRFAPACLDWTERRPHLGGALGAAVMAALVEAGWFTRGPARRVIRVTEEGRAGLEEIRR
ncbi:MAG TPA: helix-turn-helix transcriptional regulator [Gemmatimonadales bacterium]